MQEALAQALQTWPERGIPDTPEAWIMTTAKRKALDVVRRENVLAQKLARLRIEEELTPASAALADPADRIQRETEVSIPDDRLELFFACAHPALGLDDRIALTLRFVAGLSSAEVAHALLVPVPTMQQRIVRAKAKIRTMGVPFRLPNQAEFQARLATVQRVLYLLFAEGYTRSAGSIHVRDDLTAEAIRLTTVLHTLLPHSSETRALLALMLLTEARRPARTDSEDRPIPLARQDRELWDHRLLASGLAHAESAAAAGIGTYSIQASIAAVHSEAESFAATDWEQITVLYGLLEQHEPGPVVRMARAVARGRARGALEGMRLLDELADEPALVRYRPFHIARAVTLEELGRTIGATESYRRALELPGNAAEDAFILSAIAEL